MHPIELKHRTPIQVLQESGDSVRFKIRRAEKAKEGNWCSRIDHLGHENLLFSATQGLEGKHDVGECPFLCRTNGLFNVNVVIIYVANPCVCGVNDVSNH